MRNPILDIMKGIGIILVLVGHIPSSSFGVIGDVDMSMIFSMIKRIIYSFHMPLFFLLAGYTAKSHMFTGGGIRKCFIKNSNV